MKGRLNGVWGKGEKIMKTTVVKPTDNIFKVLGFPDAEAEMYKFHSEMMIDLSSYVKKSRLGKAKLAKKLGITQARLADLNRCRWQKFDLETLITLEGRLGRKVSLKLAV